MRVNLRIDPARLILRLRPLTGSRGLAFAAVNAINAAALKVQEAAFENVRRRFVVRRPAFLFGTAGRPGGAAARITPRASVGAKRPFADVSVQGGLGRGSFRRRTLLAEFERGAIRRGDPFLAVPIVGGRRVRRSRAKCRPGLRSPEWRSRSLGGKRPSFDSVADGRKEGSAYSIRPASFG